MNQKWIKGLIPVVILATCIGSFVTINAIAKDTEEKKPVDTRPTVKIENITASDYQIVITSYGEVAPLESTQLAAQVQGEVVQLHKNFIPGGLVHRGDILFTIEKDNYQADLLQAQAQLVNAQASLIEENAKQDVAIDEAKRFPNKKFTDLYLRKPQVLSAQAAVKSAQAGLKRAERNLAKCNVKAPYDALIISKNIGLGQFVNTGSPVAVLNNIESAEVLIPIAGFDSAFLPKNLNGINASVSQKGLNAFKREAIISRDLGIVDSETRMSNLVVRIEDPYGLDANLPVIKFGSYVEVKFAGQTLQQIYKLPQELVNNRTVWVVDSEDKLEAKQVQVIREEGEFFLVNQGLNNQDKLVVTLPEYPQKGMQVNIADSDVSTTEKL
ncbi:efflux transporter periplasmic adaptor subunit [Pseudoalteromonas sp. NBT06-2]|uniref:efflux RND transporter periplasmic adaptor subunit n=1 Tax=Pseudoalteromonas sp. NBT06-2 TaxID=2025950 RepID=UPI000BA763C0|nr:efflux RND transporter periplasmic adaptor subunit [Pseudoalteromonas sp. NBT06-2]PAJ75277.1 efflux transporter periplasmic adaptor subunit [Pseudoalteromonas sp. NBT06-2]